MEWPFDQQLPGINWSDPATYCHENELPEDHIKIQASVIDAVILNFATILYGVVFIVGLFGNTLVLYVVIRFSKMQTVTNMYIFNLAVADEMYLIGIIFLLTTFVYKHWMFGNILCKVYMTITSINQFTSSLLLTVMSADRYMAVCHPISAPRYRTSFIAKFICLTVWTVGGPTSSVVQSSLILTRFPIPSWQISAILMVPIFMYGNTIESPINSQRLTCNIIWPESELMKGEKAFTLYSFTLGFFLPFILIFLFYILVICRLRRVGPKNKSKEKKRSHRKVTYLVLTVIAIYVLCWLPYWIGQLYITFATPAQTQSSYTFTIILLASCLTYANSGMSVRGSEHQSSNAPVVSLLHPAAINPILYGKRPFPPNPR